MIAIVANMYSRLEETAEPVTTAIRKVTSPASVLNHAKTMEPNPEPGADVEAGAVVAVAVPAAGKEINPTKHNGENSCEFSKEYLVFVINMVVFCQ